MENRIYVACQIFMGFTSWKQIFPGWRGRTAWSFRTYGLRCDLCTATHCEAWMQCWYFFCQRLIKGQWFWGEIKQIMGNIMNEWLTIIIIQQLTGCSRGQNTNVMKLRMCLVACGCAVARFCFTSGRGWKAARNLSAPFLEQGWRYG